MNGQIRGNQYPVNQSPNTQQNFAVRPNGNQMQPTVANFNKNRFMQFADNLRNKVAPNIMLDNPNQNYPKHNTAKPNNNQLVSNQFAPFLNGYEELYIPPEDAYMPPEEAYMPPYLETPYDENDNDYMHPNPYIVEKHNAEILAPKPFAGINYEFEPTNVHFHEFEDVDYSDLDENDDSHKIISITKDYYKPEDFYEHDLSEERRGEYDIESQTDDYELPSGPYHLLNVLPGPVYKKPAYMPPEDEHMPPEDEFMPPEDEFIPPEDEYMPPEVAYMPPKEAYMLPEKAYLPPEEAYLSPEEAYLPQEEVYMPPEEAYMPPEEAYIPPEEAYLPLEEVYMPPGHDYLPPEHEFLPLQPPYMPVELGPENELEESDYRPPTGDYKPINPSSEEEYSALDLEDLDEDPTYYGNIWEEPQTHATGWQKVGLTEFSYAPTQHEYESLLDNAVLDQADDSDDSEDMPVGYFGTKWTKPKIASTGWKQATRR